MEARLKRATTMDLVETITIGKDSKTAAGETKEKKEEESEEEEEEPEKVSSACPRCC